MLDMNQVQGCQILPTPMGAKPGYNFHLVGNVPVHAAYDVEEGHKEDFARTANQCGPKMALDIAKKMGKHAVLRKLETFEQAEQAISKALL